VIRTIKICCIQNSAEAHLALELGADYIGFVSAMPSGPGPISDELITEIVSGIPEKRQSVLLTSLVDVTAIVDQQRRTGALVLQLCSQLTVDQMQQLREMLSGIKLMPVVHVSGPESVEMASRYAPHSDMLLLDSGAPNADVPVLGGTGKTHDWSVSAEVVRAVDIPVFLAGGLKAENVAEAIRRVNPAGVDICSGVRIDGMLDEDKLERFITAIRECDD
jgi:phosphoribosylanthranilate isomerase